MWRDNRGSLEDLIFPSVLRHTFPIRNRNKNFIRFTLQTIAAIKNIASGQVIVRILCFLLRTEPFLALNLGFL